VRNHGRTSPSAHAARHSPRGTGRTCRPGARTRPRRTSGPRWRRRGRWSAPQTWPPPSRGPRASAARCTPGGWSWSQRRGPPAHTRSCLRGVRVRVGAAGPEGQAARQEPPPGHHTHTLMVHTVTHAIVTGGAKAETPSPARAPFRRANTAVTHGLWALGTADGHCLRVRVRDKGKAGTPPSGARSPQGNTYNRHVLRTYSDHSGPEGKVENAQVGADHLQNSAHPHDAAQSTQPTTNKQTNKQTNRPTNQPSN
jgi:hypothetical protein